MWRNVHPNEGVGQCDSVLRSVVLSTAQKSLRRAVPRRALGDLLTTWLLTFVSDRSTFTPRDLLFALTPFLHSLRTHLFATALHRQALSQLLVQLFTRTQVHDVGSVAALAQLYTLALGLWDLKFSSNECQSLVDLFAQALQHSVDPHLAQSVLCFVLLLIQVSESEFDSCIQRLLMALLTERELTTCFELLVFIALHAHLLQAGYRLDSSSLETTMSPVVLLDDLLTRTLHVPLPLSTSAFTRLQHILTSSVLPIHRLLRHLTSLPINPRLCATSQSLSPYCVLMLLTAVYLPNVKGRGVVKEDRRGSSTPSLDFNVDISSWMLTQLQHTTRPLHPLLLPLIDTFIQCVTTPQSSKSALRPFPAPVLKEILSQELNVESLSSETDFSNITSSHSPPPTTRTAQLLFVYYILAFNSQIRQLSGLVGGSNVLTVPPYDVSDLLERTELWTLLRDAEAHYDSLYPSLLALVLAHAPQLTNARLLLTVEGRRGSLQRSTAHSTLYSPPSSSPPSALELTKSLERLQKTSAISMTELSTLLPPLVSAALREHPGSVFVTQLTTVWCHSLYAHFPEAVCLLTARALLTEPTLTHHQLLVNPLRLFAFSPSLFVHPPLFDIFLHVLHFYLTASRQYILECSENTSKQNEGYLLVVSQHSAVLQLLGELCLCPSLCTLDQGSSSSSLLIDHLLFCLSRSISILILQFCCFRFSLFVGIVSEVRAKVCMFLHNMFVDDPDLIKIIHYQGYSSALIPLLVHGVPSLHVAFGFLPDLLQHPQRSKQLFAVQLTAHLCAKYPVPRGLAVARQAVEVLRVCCTEDASLLSAMCLSMTLLGRAFPELLEELTEFLLLATPTVPLPAMSEFRSLLRQHNLL